MTIEKAILNAVKQNIDLYSEKGFLDMEYRNFMLCRLIGRGPECFEQFKILFSLMNKIKLTPCPNDPALPNLRLMEHAAAKGDMNVIKYLQLEFKVPVTVVNKVSCMNPLDYAIKNNKAEATSYLLSFGVKPRKMTASEITEVPNLNIKIVNALTEYNQNPPSLPRSPATGSRRPCLGCCS